MLYVLLLLLKILGILLLLFIGLVLLVLLTPIQYSLTRKGGTEGTKVYGKSYLAVLAFLF